MRWLTDAVYLLVGLMYLPVAIYQAVFKGKNRRGWRQRFGHVPKFDSSRRRIWVHAVSLGEMNATPRLVAALREQCPDLDLVFSSTTDTGFARGVQLYGLEYVFRFPLDFSRAVERALNRIRPSMIVLVELEVWPNLVRLAEQHDIPVVVVNGRLTDRSARRLARVRFAARSMFERLTWVGAQDEEIASRFRRLGVNPKSVEVTSSLKWDTTLIGNRVDGSDELAAALGLDVLKALWVCGSTGPGEESVILDAFRLILECNSLKPGSEHPRLAIIPRKPERFDDVAKLIEHAGYTCIRRSRCPDGETPATWTTGSVILGDTMGELRKFYSLATIVFVGRSLVPMGGSDPMEVAGLAKPIIVGPHMNNFDQPVRKLREKDALREVDSSHSLASVVRDILADRQLATAMGNRAREVVLANQGATLRTCERLIQLLNKATKG